MKTELPHKPRTLEERLRAGSPVWSPRPGFTGRVIDALPPRRPAGQPPLRTIRLWPRLAFVALTAVLVSLTVRHVSSPRGSNSELLAKDQEEPSAALPLRLPRVDRDQIQALTAKIDEPLEKELKNVVSDTRQAIRFVAANFLPSSEK
jgi:hypothetical protein